MGISASLFYRSNDPDSQTLFRRVTITPEQFERQQERWNDLADFLVVELKARSGYPIRTWLQGSYKFGTQVRPPTKAEEFDIDLGVYHCWEGQAGSGQHSAQKLKQFAQESLEAYRAKASDVVEVVTPAKSRCSRIRYSGGFHIDVPTYHLEPELDERTLAAQGGWEISDPKAIYAWFKTALDEGRRGIARRLIKYLKCWAALRWRVDEGRPSSVLLTVLAAEAVSKLSDAQLEADDDALAVVLRLIFKRVDKGDFIRNPVSPSENLNRLSDEQWSTFVAGVEGFLGTAQDACAADSLIEAADLWAKELQHFFPMAGSEEEPVGKSVALGGALPVVVNAPDVEVVATANKNPNVVYRDVNRVGPIPKDCTIRFQVRDPWKLPPGATVEWVVRNEGAEAEEVNDLGHVGVSGYTATEQSAYTGIHYMDCILRQSGRAIAVRRVEVKVSGMPVALRNPVRKPAYVRLRGRR